jgi:hypothetical protein
MPSADIAAREQVLIHVGHGGGVRIDANVAGVDLREGGPVRADKVDGDARLEHAVAFCHAARDRVKPRSVQRVRECAHQPAAHFHRQLRVGIERDNETNRRQDGAIAVNHRKTGIGRAAQEVVEFRELPAFSLPSHPALLSPVPSPLALKQEEPPGAVALVERIDARARVIEKPGVLFP